MARGLLRLWLPPWMLALGVFTAPGCFEDAATADGTTSTGTGTGTQCVAGTRACPCADGNSCDAGLTCYMGEACFPESCVPGSLNCPCLEAGGCDVDLICVGAQCVPPGDASSSTTATTATTAMTADATGDTAPMTSGTGDPACPAEDGDTVCRQCMKTACCQEMRVCDANDDCTAMVECVGEGTGIPQCAAMHAGGGPAFVNLTSCLNTADPACPPCVPDTLECLGELNFAPCTDCVADPCCGPLTACRADDSCRCLEECLAQFNSPGYDACDEECFGTGGPDILYPELVLLAQCAATNGCVEPGSGDACYQ